MFHFFQFPIRSSRSLFCSTARILNAVGRIFLIAALSANNAIDTIHKHEQPNAAQRNVNSTGAALYVCLIALPVQNRLDFLFTSEAISILLFLARAKKLFCQAQNARQQHICTLLNVGCFCEFFRIMADTVQARDEDETRIHDSSQ